MNRYVAFLRSINVGGRRVTGAELVAILSELGLTNTASFLASGNIVFDSESPANLSSRIEKALHTSLGYEVPVCLRTSKQVKAIASATPFDDATLETSNGKIQVSILKSKPAQKQLAQVLDLASDDDHLHCIGSELYWLPSGNMSDSGLDTKQIEIRLGMQTRRTIGTIERLAKKFL